MHSPTIPAFEIERLLALDAQAILDTEPEDGLDSLTQLAASVFNAPIALVSLVADDRQWFKSRVGLEACETSREVSFCAHAVADRQALVVENALEDERFHDNPLVTGDPHIRFYAGVLIHGPDPTLPLGTLCIIDREPRSFGADELAQLELIAQQVEAQLELRTALRDLSTASDAKFRLLASVGHELRTPLNGILGMQQLLEMTDLDEEQAEYVELLGVSGSYLNWSVDNLMTAALGESGEAVVAPFDLRELVAELCNLCQPEGANPKVRIRSEWPARVAAKRFGDANRVREALMKLIENAVNATPEGEVLVRVSEGDHGRISIEVRDPGVGIPEDRHDWIFDDFNQIVTDDATSPAGLGLGLALARRHVEAIDGEILLDSTVGEGSTFTIVAAMPPVLRPDVVENRRHVAQRDDEAVDRESLAVTSIMRRT